MKTSSSPEQYSSMERRLLRRLRLLAWARRRNVPVLYTWGVAKLVDAALTALAGGPVGGLVLQAHTADLAHAASRTGVDAGAVEPGTPTAALVRENARLRGRLREVFERVTTLTTSDVDPLGQNLYDINPALAAQVREYLLPRCRGPETEMGENAGCKYGDGTATPEDLGDDCPVCHGWGWW